MKKSSAFKRKSHTWFDSPPQRVDILRRHGSASVHKAEERQSTVTRPLSLRLSGILVAPDSSYFAVGAEWTPFISYVEILLFLDLKIHNRVSTCYRRQRHKAQPPEAVQWKGCGI